ncbi:MAG: ATP-binding protein [Legionellales bacterium]|nr:ATP-binding protein [Legionellales bacterium]
MPEIDRLIEDRIVQALNTFPVVYIAGPRQSGKSTLTQRIAATRHKAKYLTFDDLQIRAAAERDPVAFLHSLSGSSVVLDEIQMAPELFRPLKMIVDENRQRPDGGRGQFLLTGSASVMALPQLSDALVGRMALYTLLPFSTQEIQQTKQLTFIENIFSAEWGFAQLPNADLMTMMIMASFPELCSLEHNALRYEWCNGYINTILQRDVRILLEVEKITALPDLLRLFATRAGGLLNEASLSRDTGLNHITAKRYRLLLESLFLLQSVPAWSNNLGKRLIKAPKLYISDMNILAYLLNTDLSDLPKENPMLFGAVLENFVAIELAKQITFSTIPAKLYHYRTASGQEVDFVLEGPQNHIVGIEVKTKSRLTGKDFQHLETLQNDLGKKFRRGIVLYQGTDLVSFGQDLWAVPLQMLWVS